MKERISDRTGSSIMNRQDNLPMHRKRCSLVSLPLIILALAVLLLSQQNFTETSKQAQNNGFGRESSLKATSTSSLTLSRQQLLPPSLMSTRPPAFLHNAANIDFEGFTSYGTYNPAALDNATIRA